MVLSWRSQLLELHLFRIIQVMQMTWILSLIQFSQFHPFLQMLEEDLPVLPLIHSQGRQDTDFCFLLDSLDRYTVYYLLDHTHCLNTHRPVLRTLTYITAIQYQYHLP